VLLNWGVKGAQYFGSYVISKVSHCYQIGADLFSGGIKLKLTFNPKNAFLLCDSRVRTATVFTNWREE
jgi:hypothetical protein